MIGEGLIDERLLPLKPLNSTARWKAVNIVEKRRDDLRKQLGDILPKLPPRS
jgi:hypothetical protein